MSTNILELDQFIRSVEISKNETFSILLGAGASSSSGIPTAMDCIWQWKMNIYDSKTPRTRFNLDIKSDQVKSLIQKWLDSEGIYPVQGSEQEYSFYVEKCYPIEDDRRKFFQSICERKEPTIGYKLICLLHQTGMVQSIWTTNFDDLCRDSAIKTNNVVIDITLDAVERILRPQNNSELLLIKLHGDYKYGPLKNTSEELKEQDFTFRSRFVEYLKDKHLIVSGYSGRDVSVMQTLIESYSKAGSGRLYWCGYGPEIPQIVIDLIETAKASGRTAYYIPTDGFDKLFISLASGCLKSNNDLTKKFDDYLKSGSTDEVKTPFLMERGRINSVIKSNAFQIRFPQEVFQFDFAFKEGDRPWQTLRDLTCQANVIAVPFKKMIWAFGTLSEINKIFQGGIVGKITRVPIGDINLFKNTALYSLILSTITDTLASMNSLNSDRKSLIWKDEVITQRKMNDVIYFTHQAIKLSISTDGKNYFLSLMPDFFVSSDTTLVPIEKAIKQEIGRTYFEKLWNKQFNDYINEWRILLLRSKSSILEIEYPLNSGSGFIFKIRKSQAFAGLTLSSNSSNVLSSQFPKDLIFHRGIKYSEPELIFSNRHSQMSQIPKDFHPMRGISANRPYDHQMVGTIFSDTIQLGIICPQHESTKFSFFLKKHLTKVESQGVNAGYLITYPGFYEAFGVSLNIPEPNSEFWSFSPEAITTGSLKEVAKELRTQIIKCIDSLTLDGLKKVILLFIPDRWLEYCSYDLENEHYDLHDFIKAYCAERGIATQFIQESTISNQLKCQIYWWLSLSYYVKSLRTPWVLDALDKTTAFAGIGYSVNKNDGSSSIVLGCSHIYNSQGQGLKYRLSKVEDELFWDRQKSPHLSYKDAYKFGLSIIDLFFTTMNEPPKRVVVHKRTFFTMDEINGLKDSLTSNGIQDLDLIEINFEDDLRFVASKLKQDGMPDIDNYSILRGTCILLNQFEALLWTHGVVPSVQNPNFKFYLGGRYIPGPLRVIKHYGKSNIGLIGNEILGLTKMNWNSFDLYSQLPATVNSSNEIARIGRLLSKREGITYDYRYFI